MTTTAKGGVQLTDPPEAWDPRPDIADVLFDEVAIHRRVQELADAITADYLPQRQGNPRWNLMLVAILRGSVFFVTDLAQAIRLPCSLDFMAVASYGASGRVQILKDLQDDIKDRDVLIVEDIVDTGLTLAYLLSQLRARQPRSLAIATLVDRAGFRIMPDLPLKYVGFEVSDAFIVGYGLDFRERYRNLPFIGVLRDEILEESDHPRFAHPSEEEFAALLEFYRIRWQYEPRTFILREANGHKSEVGFSPDFYLPDLDLYIEVTTRKPHLMAKKIKKVAALRAQHPEVHVELMDRSDFELLAKKLKAREMP